VLPAFGRAPRRWVSPEEYSLGTSGHRHSVGARTLGHPSGPGAIRERHAERVASLAADLHGATSVLGLAFSALVSERQQATEQRKLTEDALRESEGKARVLLESASEGIVIVNRRGHIVLINAMAEAIFGYLITSRLPTPSSTSAISRC